LPSRPGEFHPEPLTDSGLEPLDSSGSCHRAKAAAFRCISGSYRCRLAAVVASFPLWGTGAFLRNWILAWLISWAMMLPAILFAAPAIRALSLALTHKEKRSGD
jgi:hypothetical protein